MREEVVLEDGAGEGWIRQPGRDGDERHEWCLQVADGHLEAGCCGIRDNAQVVFGRWRP